MKEQETWLKIITKAWEEEDFKARLLANANEVLKEYHIDIPDGVTYQVVEDQVVGTRYLVLPPKSSDEAPVIDGFKRNVQSGDPGF